MTSEEFNVLYEEFETMFPDGYPNPEHNPISFAYYVKIFQYYRNRNLLENEG